MLKKLFPAALVASIALATNPVMAGDPHAMPAGPQLLAGSDMSVCNSIEAATKYSVAARFDVEQTIVQPPSSYSTCITKLLKEAQEINDMFSNGFSIAGTINSFANTEISDFVNQMENRACASADGFLHTVMNGASIGGSVTNLMGVNVSYSLSMSPPAASSSSGSYGFPPPSSSSSSGTQDVPTVDNSASEASLDSEDTIVDSGGTSMTNLAEQQMPTVTGGTTLNGDTNTDPTPPTPIALVDAGKPGYSTPENASVCLLPNNGSWINRSGATVDDTDSDPHTDSSVEHRGLASGNYDTSLDDVAGQEPA